MGRSPGRRSNVEDRPINGGTATPRQGRGILGARLRKELAVQFSGEHDQFVALEHAVREAVVGSLRQVLRGDGGARLPLHRTSEHSRDTKQHRPESTAGRHHVALKCVTL
jgi:hypothetical protein